tara:strand:- start:128 stop:514 length:387 start_codon:yes stop_codon:yes gene_type:complete
MKKLMNFSMLLAVLVVASACSRLFPEKEILVQPTVVETPEIEAPVIRIVPRPDPIKMRNADIVVVTEANLQEVIDRVKGEQGDFVLYAMTAQSFEALALSLEQIKKFIEEQNAVILYYEEAVKPKENE